MKKINQRNTLSLCILGAVILMISGQNVLAHTRLEIPQIPESERVSNNIVTGHGCSDRAIIGMSIVFPDGVDSAITVDGAPHNGPLSDFVGNWGNLNQMVLSRAVFTHGDETTDSLGNVVGFWAGGGPGTPSHLNALVPFRTGAVLFKPDSCATQVKFSVSIVNICEITSSDGFINGDTVDLWTHNNLGTVYDRPGDADDGPASLTINRVSALPESCGDGIAVEVKPSAAQINRDMPIIIDDQQVWPQ